MSGKKKKVCIYNETDTVPALTRPRYLVTTDTRVAKCLPVATRKTDDGISQNVRQRRRIFYIHIFRYLSDIFLFYLRNLQKFMKKI